MVVTSKISKYNIRIKITSGWTRHCLVEMFGNIEISIDPGWLIGGSPHRRFGSVGSVKVNKVEIRQ